MSNDTMDTNNSTPRTIKSVEWLSGDNCYRGDKLELKREYVDPETDIDYHGKWVLREDGVVIDSDESRFDVAERNNVRIVYPD